MARIVNIACSICAGHAIKRSRPSEEVRILNSDLQFGKLPKNFSEEELRNYLIFSRMYNVTNDKETILELLNDWKAFFATDFQTYDEVVVWHGDAAPELIMLNLMSKLSPKNLYEVDIRKASCLYEQRRETDKNWTISLGYLSINDYDDIDVEEIKSKVNDTKIVQLQKQWDQWVKSGCQYRMNGENGEVRAYPKNILDKEIFQKLSSARDWLIIAGNLMTSSRFYISDTTVFNRIITLMYERKIKLTR